LNVKHRSAELTKALLRLFNSRNDAPIALEEIRRALSKIVSERNELKRNSIESKLRDAICNLIGRGNCDGSKDSTSYTFYNEDIWTEAKAVMNGQDNGFKPNSFYSVEFGSISHKYITSIYMSKFKAEPFKVGSGSETKRGLRFSKEVLDRLVIHYDVPDEILILDPTATDATLATHFKNGDGQNGLINDDNITSDCAQPSTKVDPQTEVGATATRIESVAEHLQHEYDKDPSTDVTSSNSSSIDSNDELGNEVNEKQACPSSTCVASVASVAEIGDNTETSSPVNPISDNKRIDEKQIASPSTCVASVTSVAGVHDSDTPASQSQTTDGEDKSKVELPLLPCPWCDYKHAIEFDLGNHLLANHRGELLKLAIGKGSMDSRIDYAIQLTKSRWPRNTTTMRTT
jgi:hypothetical protein